ncbi:MAG: hypothetical protein FJ029_06480 [Actinobacteria bacterium]|nr:hypothetical protein [Actinomycetota bacterium]
MIGSPRWRAYVRLTAAQSDLPSQAELAMRDGDVRGALRYFDIHDRIQALRRRLEACMLAAEVASPVTSPRGRG